MDDLTGQSFGRWGVLAIAPNRKSNRYWRCLCVCGTIREVQESSLVRKLTLSCGCYRDEAAREKAITHGMGKHPAYRSWQSLRQRCENPNDTAFRDYGGRGIRVCSEWGKFEAFWADMGPTWASGLTIERMDCNGHYEPGNCCWVPKSHQPKNRRNVPVLDTPWGPMLLPEAARKVGLSVVQMQVRYRKGWRGDRLFSAPAEKGARITPRNHAGGKKSTARTT